MGSWIVYAMVVGGLVTLAGLAFDRVCGLLRLPMRWTWAGALIATVAIPLAAFLPSPAPRVPARLVTALVEPESRAASIAADPWLERARAAVRESVGTATSLFREAGGTLDGALPAGAGTLWVIVSFCMFAVLAGSALRIERARLRWRRDRVLDHDVRISDDVGPAVIGFASPGIVLPRWSLDLPVDELRLVLLHESEHLRARDTRLIALALLALALAPWNLALWYQLRRLRHAIELDCDRRVLARGVMRSGYGRVLLHVADRSNPRLMSAVALIESRTRLERRLTAMIPRRIRLARIRIALAATCGIALVALACQVEPDATMPVPDAPAANPAIERDLIGGAEPGSEIQVTTSDGTTLRGIAVIIVNADGTRVPGMFRGPAKLCDVMSGGTRVFQAGQHSRLRALEPGDRITVTRRRIDGIFEREAPPPAPERVPGSASVDVSIQTQEFPYPEYLQNIMIQIKRHFGLWSRAPTAKAELYFYINRNGTVGGLDVLQGSGDFGFDLKALGAVEAAGKRGVFGPLPDGWAVDRLYIRYSLQPSG